MKDALINASGEEDTENERQIFVRSL